MQKKTPITLLLLLIISLSACNVYKEAELIVDKEADNFARTFVEQLINADSTAINKVDEALLTEEGIDFFNQFASAVHHQEIQSVKTFGYQFNFKKTISLNNGVKSTKEGVYIINYEYLIDSVYIYINIGLERQGSTIKINRFIVSDHSESVAETISFSFKNKSVRHYLALLWSILVPVLIIISIVILFKVKAKRKWLWIPFLLLANIGYVFNWTTGVITWEGTIGLLFGSSVSRGSVEQPWDIGISIPIGLIVFLLDMPKKRKKKSEHLESNNPIAEAEGSDEKQD